MRKISVLIRIYFCIFVLDLKRWQLPLCTNIYTFITILAFSANVWPILDLLHRKRPFQFWEKAEMFSCWIIVDSFSTDAPVNFFWPHALSFEKTCQKTFHCRGRWSAFKGQRGQDCYSNLRRKNNNNKWRQFD